MKCDELKPVFVDMSGNIVANELGELYYKPEVDAAIAELKRALYKALANWAKCEERINNRDAYEASEYLPSAEDKFRKKAERWSEMERKCRAKAEEYK